MSRGPVSLETTRQALAHIPAHDRDLWVRMSFAVKSEHGEDGFPVWDEWSRGADNYKEKSAHETWKSAKPFGPVTIGTLLHEAKARGFVFQNGEQSCIDPGEIERHKRERAEALARQEAERKELQARAVRLAAELLNAGTLATDHPYTVAKGITPPATVREIPQARAAEILGYSPKADEIALEGRLLVIPVKINGALTTLELIDGAGRKSAIQGGAKAGGYWAEALPESGYAGPLQIAEGFAARLAMLR